MEAVQMLRETKGRSPEPRSLFTAFKDYLTPELSLTADMIVDRKVQDDFGVPAEAAISTLRYEVAFRLATEAGAERLELARESLKHISLSDARRGIAFTKSAEFKNSSITGRRTEAFISTNPEGEIIVHQEGHGGRRLPAPKSSRTVISGMATSDFPTVLAANKEMASWQTLLLEPSAMRAASSYQDPRYIDARGANLPATIYRLQKQEARHGQVCSSLANKLSELIQDVEELRIRDDPKTESLTLEVRGRDGIPLPARSLSDGTLRFLVLATLGLDPAARGLICLEEPENGIHPERIPTIVRLLKEIAVDPEYAVGDDNPLRQVLVNTHSPEIVQNIDKSDLVFLDDQYILRDMQKGRVAAVRIPDGTWRAQADKQTPRLAPGNIASYLGTAAPRESRQLWLKFAQESITPL
jgi:predicted ATPase